MTTAYFSLASGNFFQDWSDTSLIGTSDNWSGVASIMGYRGDNLTAVLDANAGTLTAHDAAPVVDVNANQTTPNSYATGGVTEFELANPVVALQGSGTADAPYLQLFLDATGRSNVVVSFTVRDLETGTDNAVQQIAVQYRIGESGAWTNLGSGYYADVTVGSASAADTPVTVTLPDAANGQAMVQVRILTVNATGNDEWVGIDDIRVVSDAAGTPPEPLYGTLAIADVSLKEGASGTTDFVFTVTRSGGSDGAVGATWTVDFPAGADSSDLDSTLTGTVSFAEGETSATVTVRVNGDLDIELSEQFQVVLSAATGGAAIGDGVGVGTIVNDDFGPMENVWINEIHYDNVGTDSGEMVEIAGLAGTDLTGWTIAFYRSAGTIYATDTLSGALADSGQGFGTLAVPRAGIQNGTSAIALIDSDGRVVQFLSYEGTVTATEGAAIGLTSTNIGVAEEPAPGVGVSLQLQGTGSSYGDFQWVAAVAQTGGATNAGQNFLSGSEPGQIRIADASVIEGHAGTATLTFTVTRAGGFDFAASVDYAVALGEVDLADLAPGAALSGTVSFAAGEFTKTVTLAIAGDTLGELNEQLTVSLSNPVGPAVIVDGEATGTIVNDDRIALTIMEIQGEGHASAFVGQPIVTTGIVTAVDSKGFFLQDATGDGNARTSDGIYVHVGVAPTVAVGDRIELSGTVDEYASGTNLSVTEIAATQITVLSTGNALPAAVVIGSGGLLPPTEAIDSDGLATFNPEGDGIDFWESLEGMRVTIDTPQAVSATNAYGETDVVASLGEGASGMNGRGGITIDAGDYNPEKIQIDTRLVTGAPVLSQGDQMADVTGVVHYGYGAYEIVATAAPTVTRDETLADEATSLRGDSNYLTVATYNVENLDTSDNKFDLLADDIVYSLGAPDIIALQEVQDTDGVGSGSDLSGNVTAQGLIDAIYAESGLVYTYLEIAPTVAGSTGGEPGGNIRCGYLYLADRVSYVEGSAELLTDAAFTGSRKPLVATWSFGDEEVTTINVHFTSRLGSDPLWGANQPPVDGGDAARTAQAGAVLNWANAHLADDPAMNIMVLGDWNGFWFEEAQMQMTRDGVFTNAAVALLTPEERYSYVFQGNAQLIDNILVTGGLLGGAAIDGVHINAESPAAGRATDHDPQVIRLLLGPAPHDIVIDDAMIAENSGVGALVGTVSASDSAGDTLHYTLADDAGGTFAINELTGALTATRNFDFETETGFDIVVTVRDGAGQSVTRELHVTVTDGNDAPVAANDRAAVVEDRMTTNLWATLLANDSDADGDALAIQSVDTQGTYGSVVFDPLNRKLVYLADGDVFDWLAPGQTFVDRFTYTVVDSDGATHQATVEMTVTGRADGIHRRGGMEADRLSGSSGEDILVGANGDDILSGGAGHDVLAGERGSDHLDGGIGHDLLIGGAGSDRMGGGAGADSFVFAPNSGHDRVYDFSSEDRIVLTGGLQLASTRTQWMADGSASVLLTFSDGGSVTLTGAGWDGDVHFGAMPVMPFNNLPGYEGVAFAGMGWGESEPTLLGGFGGL